MSIKKVISRIKKNELFMGGLTLLVLINLANLINYIFHFGMARMLTPSDYGILAVLTSIIYIFSVPTFSIQTLISKKMTEFSTKKELNKVKGFFEFSKVKLFKISFVLFVVFCALSFFLSSYLDISLGLMILTGSVLFGTFLSPLTLGTLQGLKKFKIFGFNQILGSSIKLVLSVVLVMLGFKVYGAIIGFVVGILATFFMALPFLKEILSHKKIEKTEIKFFTSENFPMLLAMLVIILMYSLDIIVAKRLFEPDLAGKYAVASMFGKMIFAGTIAISSAMFPISSERFLIKKNTTEMFKKTFGAVFLACAFVTTIYIFFPSLLVKLLFGAKYVEISGILKYIGVTFSLISMLNIIVLYRISTNKFKLSNAFTLLFYLIFMVSIMVIYGSNLVNFSIAFMTGVAISFLGNLLLILARR